MIIKQSTAKKLPCLLYDKTDFITPETGVAYTTPTVYIQKEDGSQTTKTLASGDWTERGHGVYDISFTASELDTLGAFKYQVTDGRATFLDYNGLVMIESANLSDLDTDIATVDGVVDAILVDTGTTLPAEHAALPTATEIDTELTSSHGSGAWTDSSGTGTYNVTIHCKDGSSVDIPDAKVSVHNASNDDTPLIATAVTDSSGNAEVSLNAGSYTVRATKAGYTFANITPTISASGTQEMTGAGVTITPPSDPSLCRLVIYPIKLDGTDITSDEIDITIATASHKTEVGGEFIWNAEQSFTYDSTTTPDSYYFDAVQSTSETNIYVRIVCDELGIKSTITVPSESTKDISELL